MSSGLDILHTSWEFQGNMFLNDSGNLFHALNNAPQMIRESSECSFIDLLAIDQYSKQNEQEVDSFLAAYIPSDDSPPPTSSVIIKQEPISFTSAFPSAFPITFPNHSITPASTPTIRHKTIQIKKEKKKLEDPFHKKESFEIKVPKRVITAKEEEVDSEELVLSKDNAIKGKGSKADNVRNTWWKNLNQITSKTMIPSKMCLYKFENPENCPWNSNEGHYIFEIHLLQSLSAKEAWNFKRYVDNHSKKAGDGQTFILCSSIHKDEWKSLEMKSNKFFKKTRMININALKEKNGFIHKGKWKYIYQLYQQKFDDCVVNTLSKKK